MGNSTEIETNINYNKKKIVIFVNIFYQCCYMPLHAS